jgi:hypothetical protein
VPGAGATDGAREDDEDVGMIREADVLIVGLDGCAIREVLRIIELGVHYERMTTFLPVTWLGR